MGGHHHGACWSDERCGLETNIGANMGRYFQRPQLLGGRSIWIRTKKERRLWSSSSVGEHFDGLILRETGAVENLPKHPKQRPSRRVSPERLNPIEVIGEPTNGEKAGVVYLLKSAYGYKVGRTRNVPARMRAFGVHLPFIYTIPLCSWFSDCHAAERRYHKMFAEKRINGEWFDLGEDDIQQIRLRA